NATMVDVDNVLLLRPAEGGPALEGDPARRPPGGAPAPDAARPAALGSPAADGAAAPTAVIGPAEADLEVIESALGESVLARFVTEHARNDFPALPVREDVDVVVWLAAGEHELPAGVERLRLQPTPRSLLPSSEQLSACPAARGSRPSRSTSVSSSSAEKRSSKISTICRTWVRP